MLIRLVKMSRAITTELARLAAWPNCMTFFFGIRSAITPPKTERTSIGTAPASPTRPSAANVSAAASDSALQGTLTENDNVVGEITVAGTIGLVFFGGVLFGAGGGMFYVTTRRWLADLGRWRGPAFGVLLFAILGNAVVDGNNEDFRRFGPAGLNLAMFSSLYILFGVLVAPLYDRLQRAVPPSFTDMRPLAVLTDAFGLLLALAIVLPIVFLGFGGEPVRRFLLTALPLYLLLGLPLLAALLEGRVGRFDRLSDLKQHPSLMLLAVAALIAPVAVGLTLDARALREILWA